MSEHRPQNSKRLELRKYPNRRYYDVTRSRHVKLEEIRDLVRDGYEVQVTDSKTGQDITGKVLAQIILELDSPKLDIFPVELLHRVIRANEQIVEEFIEKYFHQAFAAFVESQRQFESYLRQAMGLAGGPGSPGEWMRMMLGPLAMPFWMGGANPAGDVPVGSQAGTDRASLERELAELRAQVEALRRENNGGRS